MDTYYIKLHSVIDLITNSSTELFIVNSEDKVEILNDFIKIFHSNHFNENAFVRALDIEDEYILSLMPSGVDINSIYVISVNNWNDALKSFIEKYFTILHRESY